MCSNFDKVERQREARDAGFERPLRREVYGSVWEEEEDACPFCGSVDAVETGIEEDRIGMIQSWLCDSCGEQWNIRFHSDHRILRKGEIE